MEWLFYGVAFVVALAISASAVYLLNWAAKKGQLKNLDKQAESIFDQEEPLGEQTDYFPGKGPRPDDRSPSPDRQPPK
jgi:nitrogen fixation-related uncharacterized protein